MFYLIKSVTDFIQIIPPCNGKAPREGVWRGLMERLYLWDGREGRDMGTTGARRALYFNYESPVHVCAQVL